MKKIQGACLFGQSGGPTSVINASCYGIISESFKNKEITNVYALRYGIEGIFKEDFIEVTEEDQKEIDKLIYTPGALFGSARRFLPNHEQDDTDYIKIYEFFKKYNIRYFFLVGGNDSMDTCNKVSKYLLSVNYDCNVIGVPKTIDNDLNVLDHTPGFGSCAKYICTSISEIHNDIESYKLNSVVIVEIMGRNAGWLTASSYLATLNNCGPDLIYLPEKKITIDEFIADVQRTLKIKNNIIIAVSEGIHIDWDGNIHNQFNNYSVDQFGHKQLGGIGTKLMHKLKNYLPSLKVRTIELSLLQRCASHMGSLTDVEEAIEVGKFAVNEAIKGKTDKVVAIKRKNSQNYETYYELENIENVANFEKCVPINWIKDNNTGMTQDFIDYALPLIQGELQYQYKNGLIDYAKIENFKNNK